MRCWQGAQRAKEAGASRYCMGAAWRSPKDRDMDAVCEMIKGVRAYGHGNLHDIGHVDSPSKQASLKEAGLDYYNHNVDTSEEFYGEIITTRNFEDRLETIGHVQDAGINVCAGGIFGMGEEVGDRASMLMTLANLNPQPQSVPINMLIPIAGTPMGDKEAVDPIDFVRCIAVARIMMPKSVVRLSAGREWMSDETQALCFSGRGQFDFCR